MYKRLILVLLVVIAVALPLNSAIASDVYRTQTEMIQWDPDRAYNGYNAIYTDGIAYLIDMEGQIVNTWNGVDTTIDWSYYALENGRWRFNVKPSYAPMGVLSGSGARGRIEEYTWKGERVWYWDVFDGTPQADPTYPYSDATFRQHHDYSDMWNKDLQTWTYLALIWIAKDATDAVNLGGDPQYSQSWGGGWSPCALVELLPDYEAGVGGDIVWYWTFADHMVTTDPGATAATAPWPDASGRTSMPPVVVADAAAMDAYPHKLNVNGIHNAAFGGPRRDYQHCNSFDYDARTGHIAINAKACNEFFVIDHDGTFNPNATRDDWNSVGEWARRGKDDVAPGEAHGDFLYRFGMPANYSTAKVWPTWYNEGDAEMYGAHDIQFIDPYHWREPNTGDTWADPASYGTQFALPGGGQHPDDPQNAGNFLMFDNGWLNPRLRGSNVLEVNPYIYDRVAYNDSGSVNAPPNYVDPATLSRLDQVVWSHGNSIYDFYSTNISGITRMPNGNTIVCSGAKGHLFEVTEDNEVVWEYVVPRADGDGGFCTYADDNPGSGCRTTLQFRSHRFSSSHPALRGKDLRQQGTLTGRIPGTFEQYSSAPTGWGTGNKVGAGGGGGAAAGGGGAGGY
jgi:hypothetical protein